ncbi:hypothetical protein PMKS-001501 [Pichia membranifaciens]|uniref:candidapepsin n=1 Tax=Pichia membranifaciens TaxID=4926 RepID=A0A1Q2YF63_9ASCO|nr:hypothetical protein PMKS-001501 [Pichia membranifaciens]
MLFNKAVVAACLLELAAPWAAAEADDKYFSLKAHREYFTDDRLVKRSSKSDKSEKSDKSSSSFQTDLDFMRLGFYLEAEIGSNKDTVKVLIDTGSSDFWVPTSDVCASSSDSDSDDESSKSSKHNDDDDDDDDDSDTSTQNVFNCKKFGSFDPSKSKTFHSNNTEFALSYGDTSCAMGVWGQDTVVIDNATIHNVNLAVANFTNSTSGIIGIGYEATEATYFSQFADHPYKYINFPAKLAADGVINKAAYSLFLDEQGDAEVLFGAVDASQYTGTLYQFPIVPMNASSSEISRIAITLNSLALNNGKLEAFAIQGYIPAVLDSGTTFAALPFEVALTVATLLGLSYSESLGRFYGDCSITENVNFIWNFQGVEFTSPVSSYFANVVDDEGSEGCIFQAMITEEEFIILGDAFLRDIYTVIDLEDNVAALAYKQNSTSSSIKVISSSIPGASKPPKAKSTFGGKNSQYTYYVAELTTTNFKSTKTPTLETGYETITISAESAASGDYSDYYSDYYTDDFTDDYSDYYSDDYTDDFTFNTAATGNSHGRGGSSAYFFMAKDKTTVSLTGYAKAVNATSSSGSGSIASIITATASAATPSSNSENGAGVAAPYSTGFAFFALLASLFI